MEYLLSDTSRVCMARGPFATSHQAPGLDHSDAWSTNILVRIRETVRLWIIRYQGRRRIVDLDDRLLEDIGITREQAAAEYRKFFWQP